MLSEKLTTSSSRSTVQTIPGGKQHEKRARTRALLKAISWRGTGSLATVLAVFYFTGELQLAAAIGATEATVKIGLYYVHERFWDKVWRA